MIGMLLSGKAHSAGESRTSKAGREFATIKLLAASDDGAVWVNVVCFQPDGIRALLSLHAGDPVAVVGFAKLGAYTSKAGEIKPSVDVVAESVLTLYQLDKRRKPLQAPADQWEAP